jgi:hypothetical protein
MPVCTGMTPKITDDLFNEIELQDVSPHDSYIKETRTACEREP